MQISKILLKSVTMYTRPHCALCEKAKHNILRASEKVAFDYREVDITKPENVKYLKKYWMDIPVVHIDNGMHVEEVVHRLSTEKALEILGS